MTIESPKPDQAAAASKPFNWDEYLERVNKSALAAEEHLQVPPGTISSIPGDSDFVATVKAYAIVEPLLNDLLAAWPPKTSIFGALAVPVENDAFRSFITALPISGNLGKLKLAEGLGLLADRDVPFVRALTRVRNRYAHNVKNIHRSLTEILTEEQEHNQKIVAQLTGLQLAHPLDPSDHDTNFILKILMYHRLADYLASALSTLRPPPAPPGGLLGALMAQEAKDSLTASGG
jgi:hypothetical protein